MKTTLELPDDLLIEAKAVATRRRTTLKAMFDHALRRELAPPLQLSQDSLFEVGPFGILSLKKRGEPMMTEQVQHLIDHQYDEKDARTLEIASKG